MADILKYLDHIVPLTETQSSAFKKILNPLSLKKGDTFMDYNQKADKIAFVEEGLLEMTICEDGNERVIDFLSPGSFAADYLNFLQNNLSEIKITALANSQLMYFSKDALANLYESDIVFQKIGRIMAEKYYVEYVQMLRRINMTAKERYEIMLRNSPDLIQQVPQYKIASFLNVSAEWLSKLRSKR
jgi:CRP-like cAMP-binding protein